MFFRGAAPSSPGPDAVVPDAEQVGEHRADAVTAGDGVAADVSGDEGMPLPVLDSDDETTRDHGSWIVLNDDDVAAAKAEAARAAREQEQAEQQQRVGSDSDVGDSDDDSDEDEDEENVSGIGGFADEDDVDHVISSSLFVLRRPRTPKSLRICKNDMKDLVTRSRMPWDEIVGVAIGVSAVLGGIYLCNKLSPPDDSTWRVF